VIVLPPQIPLQLAGSLIPSPKGQLPADRDVPVTIDWPILPITPAPPVRTWPVPQPPAADYTPPFGPPPIYVMPPVWPRYQPYNQPPRWHDVITPVHPRQIPDWRQLLTGGYPVPWTTPPQPPTKTFQWRNEGPYVLEIESPRQEPPPQTTPLQPKQEQPPSPPPPPKQEPLVSLPIYWDYQRGGIERD
jgi:hypothetical protein